MKSEPTIEVYGAEQVCASCVNAPSSVDTYEWLQAALTRKYPDQPFSIEYIDIEKEQPDGRKSAIIQKIQDDEFFYPLVLVDGQVAGEGYIQLKSVCSELEKQGFTASRQ